MTKQQLTQSINNWNSHSHYNKDKIECSTCLKETHKVYHYNNTDHDCYNCFIKGCNDYYKEPW